ncbi:hypothetical protein ACIO93_35535 [Streptomyces sp. NPDC087903]|uniref:hypothetical protein n=1 Tax=Streptomyces sp. NPDC087903 TaxID=3365819 RepID=UPI0038039AEC
MVQNLVAVFSLLIGLVGLMLSYAGHRQKVRQDVQEYALRAEELRKVERDREQERQLYEREARARREREVSVQRAQERHQASMIGGHIVLFPSPLNDSWVVPRVMIQNGSNQPVRDVRVSLRGEVINELPIVGTGHDFFPLAPAQITDERYDQLGHITLEFTDAAGIRWRREAYGNLQRARQGTTGQEDWEAPELPLIATAAPSPRPSAPPCPSPSLPPSEQSSRMRLPARADQAPSPAPTESRAGERIGFRRPVVVLVSVVLIAGGVWWLLHH